MAALVDIINRIHIPTGNLRTSIIQEVLRNTKAGNNTDNDQILWSNVADILWAHLIQGLKDFDDQLLCATCFYTVSSLTNKQETLLNDVLLLTKQQLTLHQNLCKPSVKNTSTPLIVSLMYGMFQSSLLTNNKIENIPNVVEILETSVELLISMSSEYSRYTFLVFKTIHSFKKVLNTKFCNYVYSETNIKRFLILTNHNWENPVTGVRDLNKLIFKTILDIAKRDIIEIILKQISSFYWNKAKYLMLAEIIEQCGQDYNFNIQEEWVEGLFYSLNKPGLVSAGTDMYCSIIKNLRSQEDWCKLFLNRCVQIFNGKIPKAVENFSNYWCITTLKKFPNLLEILIEDLSMVESSELNLFSCLCILKQGTKLGLVGSNNNIYLSEITGKCTKIGIVHWNPHVRMLAFDIISICHGKTLQATSELNEILDYLENNVNSDCTVLRISMLNSLNYFLSQLQKYVSIKIKVKNYEIDGVLTFYKRIQEFIVNSLNINGNYQRKVTTLKMCNMLLSSFHEAPKRKQKSKNNDNISLVTILKEKSYLTVFEETFIMILFNHLKDPADDIRENTIQLLMNHYSGMLTQDHINYLIHEAQTGIRSKFFFQINCGQGIFRLITSLLLKKEYTKTTFHSPENIFSNIISELIIEYELKRNVVESIETGKQMYSLLGVILEVLKVVKLNSSNIDLLDQKFPLILEILDNASNQFTLDEESSASSDFAKMNDMIQEMILASGYDITDDKDLTKISGLHQIVLNCIWFNVKAACDLASFMLQFLQEKQTLECEKCLTIIMHVLEISRHKGAIEAAGAALGRAIQYLTSLPENNRLSHIPLSLLKCKLSELMSYANMASVTRRGAGLSIMVHRIVSNDMNKGKPLFHYFMEIILDACSSATELPSNDDGQKDMPKAIYIHFLTRIVTDSSLASDMMYYSVELAELAFDNLTSPHWQIRNAALQLYGALIPKLIGQKKASGTDDETVATVACDEFRIHSPKLWADMEKCLERASIHEDTVLAHSNVLPILNVLANLAKRYSFSLDATTQDCYDESLLRHLTLLLASPIYTVRRLSAKCIFNIFDFDIIYTMLIQHQLGSENMLHGSLLLIVNCQKYYAAPQYRENFNEFKEKLRSLFAKGTHSYVCKQIYEELFSNNNVTSEIEDTLLESKVNSNAPGISNWAKSRLRKFISHSSWERIIEIITVMSETRDLDEYCHYIFKRIESEDASNETLQALGSKLLELDNISKYPTAWKIIYYISSKINISGNIFNNNLLRYLEKEEILYTMRFAIPYFATKSELLHNQHLVYLSDLIFKLSDPEKSDVDMRYIAVVANNELAKGFSKLPNSIKVTVLKTAIIILQDEDEDVRNTGIYFYRYTSHNSLSGDLLHSYVCLHKIMDYEFLKHWFGSSTMEIIELCTEIEKTLDSYNKTEIDEYNPFVSDSKNIYFEVDIVKKLIIKLQKSIE